MTAILDDDARQRVSEYIDAMRNGWVAKIDDPMTAEDLQALLDIHDAAEPGGQRAVDMLEAFRKAAWIVIAHYDRPSGDHIQTFWVLLHAPKFFVSGGGFSDDEALAEAAAAARELGLL